MATLKVNLAAFRNACEQDGTPPNRFPRPGWYAFLRTCDGQPFVNAGKEYGPFPVDHGYVEIDDVPPGRYLLFAILNPFRVGQPIQHGILQFQANYTSHYAVVEVCCRCEDICVILANPGWHYCVRVVIQWFRLLERAQRLNPELKVVDNETLGGAVRQLEAVANQGGEPQEGDRGAIAALEQLTEQFLGQMEAAAKE